MTEAGAGPSSQSAAKLWTKAGNVIGAVTTMSKHKMWLDAFHDNMTRLGEPPHAEI